MQACRCELQEAIGPFVQAQGNFNADHFSFSCFVLTGVDETKAAANGNLGWRLKRVSRKEGRLQPIYTWGYFSLERWGRIKE